MANVPLDHHDDESEIDDPELLVELDATMEEAERGEGMDAFEFLRQLRDETWRDA
jgi:CheY-like chemotaxis protein